MKTQNDMIFSISAIVLALIAGAIFFFTRPEVPTLPDPQPVPTANAQFTPGAVTMAASLPGGGGGPGAGPAAGRPAGGGGGGTNLGAMKSGGAARPAGGAGIPEKGKPTMARG